MKWKCKETIQINWGGIEYQNLYRRFITNPEINLPGQLTIVINTSFKYNITITLIEFAMGNFLNLQKLKHEHRSLLQITVTEKNKKQ